MSTEINTKDQIAAMLSAKLNEFLDGVGDSYGKVILDELVTRLEYTITDFKDEVGEVMEQMLENAANKKEILSDVLSSEKPILDTLLVKDKNNSIKLLSKLRKVKKIINKVKKYINKWISSLKKFRLWFFVKIKL